MAIDFPATPTDGQTYTSNNRSWVYRSSANSWIAYNTGTSLVVSSTPPTSAVEGLLWWDTDDGSLRIYYNDGDTSQWVDAISMRPSVYYANSSLIVNTLSVSGVSVLTGNVSIGTSNTGTYQFVCGDGRTDAIFGGYTSLGRMYSGADSYFGHNVYGDATTRKLKQLNTGYYAAWLRLYYNGGIYFGTSTAAGTAGDVVCDTGGTTNEKMVLTNAGKLGVGNLSPVATLHINAGSTNYNPNVTSGVNSAINFTSAEVELSQGVHSSSPYAWWVQAKSGGAVWKMALNPLGGAVGIGTVAPGYPLHVAADAGGEFCVERTNASYTSKFKFTPGYTTEGDLALYDVKDSKLRIYIDSAGNVGIGTTSAGASLDVNGSIITNSVYNMRDVTNPGTASLVWAVYADTNLLRFYSANSSTAGYFAQGSDLTLSNSVYVVNNCSALSFTDRTPFYDGDALVELKAVKGKKDKDGKDVIDHSTLPPMARRTITHRTETNDVEEHEGRDLGAMISILTKAVQQLTAQIETLDTRIEALENK